MATQYCKTIVKHLRWQYLQVMAMSQIRRAIFKEAAWLNNEQWWYRAQLICKNTFKLHLPPLTDPQMLEKNILKVCSWSQNDSFCLFLEVGLLDRVPINLLCIFYPITIVSSTFTIGRVILTLVFQWV